MEQQRKVQTIPATLTRFTATPLSAQKKRKVAGYARVSTDHDDQFTSYEAQIDYYTNYIKGRDDWEFVSVYTDEGITGTSTKHREGFKRMIADALDGRIEIFFVEWIQSNDSFENAPPFCTPLHPLNNGMSASEVGGAQNDSRSY